MASSFDFDCESNIVCNKIPSAKAINKYFCGRRNAAGLWIADDNMNSCRWKKECEVSCNEDCCEHFIGVEPHCIQASTKEVMGRGVTTPRICVIRRSKLLKLTSDKGVYSGLWIKGDGDIKLDSGIRKYNCARRYLIMFLDCKNIPLHEEPIQLTAKGNFQMSFDNNLMKFRDELSQNYCKEMKRQMGKINEEWFSMGVFVPTFESKTVGKPPNTSQACLVNSYEIPANWQDFSVGRNLDVNRIIHLKYLETREWVLRYDKDPTPSASPSNDCGEYVESYDD